MFKITRSDNDIKGVTVLTETEKWLAVVCDGITRTEHESLKGVLECHLGLTSSVDLYYTRNLISIFIFNAEAFDAKSPDSARETIKAAIPYVTHNTVYKNTIYGRKMNRLLVTTSKTEFKVSKKYQVLLTLKHE